VAQTVSTPPRRSPARRVADRLGLDLVELTCLVLLCGVSVAVLLPLLTRGRPLSGADGLFPADQLQYFTWIREASNHVLIGNLFDLAPGERSFFHPGFLLTGVVHAVTGIGIPWVYLILWKPVTIALLFWGALRYIRRFLPAGGQRHTALVLALFAVMPTVAIVAWTGWGGRPRQYTFDFISGEMWTGQYLWGYLFTGIAVGLMPFVLLAVERWRDGRAGTRTLVLAALGASIVMFLQPWQGATLCGIVVGVEVWRRLRTGEPLRWGLLAIPLAAAPPAVYYWLLSHYDAAWKLAGESNAAGAQPEWSWPWWTIALTLLPLALPAALAYRLPARTWQDVALRLWPFAAAAVYLQPAGTFPYHSLQGIALPLSVLAVQGVVALRERRGFSLRPAWVVAALAVMTLPGFAHKLSVAADNVHMGADPYFIFPDEQKALRALENDPRAGGVLAPLYSGFLVPYTTGRETYVGALSWSPDWRSRRTKADALFEGRLVGAPALEFVRSTRARFLYADCRKLADLTALLGPELERVDRYGCATVYVLRERPYMSQAAGPPDS
jgi:hypothetical protein